MPSGPCENPEPAGTQWVLISIASCPLVVFPTSKANSSCLAMVCQAVLMWLFVCCCYDLKLPHRLQLYILNVLSLQTFGPSNAEKISFCRYLVSWALGWYS